MREWWIVSFTDRDGRIEWAALVDVPRVGIRTIGAMLAVGKASRLSESNGATPQCGYVGRSVPSDWRGWVNRAVTAEDLKRDGLTVVMG